MKRNSILVAGMLLALANPVSAATNPAPEWEIVEWLNDTPGSIADNRGKVILVHFFQLWCPACNEVTQPLFDRWHQEFGERGDLLIVGVHTVFEGHDQQSPERLRAWIKEREITYPVGIDRHDSDDPTPITMQRFDTGGTPHVVMIDRGGHVRFDRFGSFEASEAKRQIETLLAEPVPPDLIEDPKTGRDADARVATELSGAYRLQFRQQEKTCGRNRTLVVDPLVVQAGRGELTFSYTEPYLRRNTFTLPFDATTGAIEHRSEFRVEQERLTVNFEFEGAFVEDSSPTRFEFELWMEIVGDDKGSDCELRVKGWADKK